MSAPSTSVALVGPVQAEPAPPQPLGRAAMVAYSDIIAILADLGPKDRRRVALAVGLLPSFASGLLAGKKTT